LFVAGLVDPETLEPTIFLVKEPTGRLKGASSAAAGSLARSVASGFRPLLARDIRRDILPEPLRTLPASPAVRSLIAAPVTVEGKVAGFLSIQSRRVGAFDPPALFLLRTAAGQAGMAIESGRNYQRAIRDELTGLYLREPFFQRLQDELLRSGRYGGAFALLMLDIDGFKGLNDRYGHIAGDRYLREVGNIIAASLRAADVPCRYGGEEFCLLLPETDPAGARAIAERIRESVAALAIRHGEEVVRATISIGVSVHAAGPTVETPTGLVQRADEALYAAKRAGKNRVMSAAA
jgi:diguanylate cyclase (GGDEF)-like protein